MLLIFKDTVYEVQFPALRGSPTVSGLFTSLPCPKNCGHDSRVAAAMQPSNHLHGACIRRIRNQVVTHGLEPSGAGGEVRPLLALMGKRYQRTDGVRAVFATRWAANGCCAPRHSQMSIMPCAARGCRAQPWPSLSEEMASSTRPLRADADFQRRLRRPWA